MKKLDFKLKLRFLRLARYNHVKRQKRKKCLSVDTRRKFVKPDERIYAPVNFSLTQGNGVQFVKFLKAVAHRVLIQQKKEFR
ncbi:MAG: hypothetical protein VW548_01105, partial [Methylotenera sp.]